MKSYKKKMTTEQKAKAYDEAIERAKNYYSTTDSASDIKLIGLIFPELKESEDERIRKDIVEAVELHKDFTQGRKERIYVWLEKHADTQKKIDHAYAKGLAYAQKALEKQGEHDMGISEATKQELEDSLNKALEKETSESCNEFLDEQKPAAWSEEDEARFESCIEVLQTSDGYDTINAKWLKSLKERYIWKPSDEQMKALGNCIGKKWFDKGMLNMLKTLYNDLQNL